MTKSSRILILHRKTISVLTLLMKSETRLSDMTSFLMLNGNRHSVQKDFQYNLLNPPSNEWVFSYPNGGEPP